MKPLTDINTDLLDPQLLDALSEDQSELSVPPDIASQIHSRLMRRVNDADITLVTIRDQDREWHTIKPRLHIKLLKTEADNSVASYLVRLDPGYSEDKHSHPFDEECLILQGTVTLSGVELHAGDYQFAHKGSEHRDVRSEHGALLYIRGANPFAHHPAM